MSGDESLGAPGGAEPSALTTDLTDWHREFCDGSGHVAPVGFENGEEFGADGHGEPFNHGVTDQCMCGHVPYWMCPDYFGYEYAGVDLRAASREQKAVIANAGKSVEAAAFGRGDEA